MVGFLLICSLLLVLPCSYGIEYPNGTSFNGGNYTVRWKFENETEMFYFKVEVKTTGWIGFGISRLLWPKKESLQWNRKSMQYYDVIVGGIYDNSTRYYKDYLTNGHVPPEEDEKQNWIVTNITEIDGVTTMEFNRKKDTGDVAGDNIIGPGKRWMVWAYHDTNDTNDTTNGLIKHTHEGFKEVDFIKLPRETPVVAHMSDPPTTGASTIAASIIGKSQNSGYCVDLTTTQTIRQGLSLRFSFNNQTVEVIN